MKINLFIIQRLFCEWFPVFFLYTLQLNVPDRYYNNNNWIYDWTNVCVCVTIRDKASKKIGATKKKFSMKMNTV